VVILHVVLAAWVAVVVVSPAVAAGMVSVIVVPVARLARGRISEIVEGLAGDSGGRTEVVSSVALGAGAPKSGGLVAGRQAKLGTSPKGQQPQKEDHLTHGVLLKPHLGR
jgi:hypothetical protein